MNKLIPVAFAIIAFAQGVVANPTVAFNAPTTGSTVAPRSANTRAESERHQAFASERVEDHFRYEYQIGSNAVKVTSAKVSPEETVWVHGWAGRFRTTGKAHVEYFDSQTRTFGRLSREFEIVTEENDAGTLKVMSLRVR